MLDILNNIFYTYINLYRISILLVLLFQWFVLSHIDRIHFRTRTRKCGSYISNIIAYTMIKKNIYEYFRLYLIRPICVILESVCGFMEGIENYETIIIICDDTKQNINIVNSPVISYDNATKKTKNINCTNSTQNVLESNDSDQKELESTESTQNELESNDSDQNELESNDSDQDVLERTYFGHTDLEKQNKLENDISVRGKLKHIFNQDINIGNINLKDNKHYKKTTYKPKNKQTVIKELDSDSLDEELDDDTNNTHTPSLNANIQYKDLSNITDSESSLQKARKRRRIPIRLARRRYNNM